MLNKPILNYEDVLKELRETIDENFTFTEEYINVYYYTKYIGKQSYYVIEIFNDKVCEDFVTRNSFIHNREIKVGDLIIFLETQSKYVDMECNKIMKMSAYFITTIYVIASLIYSIVEYNIYELDRISQFFSFISITVILSISNTIYRSILRTKNNKYTLFYEEFINFMQDSMSYITSTISLILITIFIILNLGNSTLIEILLKIFLIIFIVLSFIFKFKRDPVKNKLKLSLMILNILLILSFLIKALLY